MFLSRIKLTNYRGFRELDLPLHRHLTVLVGRNGSGKSSVLEAIYLGLRTILRKPFPSDEPPLSMDIHSEQPRALIEGEISLDEGASSFQVRLTRSGAKASVSLSPSPPFSTELKRLVPLVFYRVDRAQIGDTLTPARLAGYWSMHTIAGVERPGFTSLEHLIAWFREREDLENQERVRHQDLSRVDPSLDAARRAINVFLGQGYSNPRIERTQQETLLLIDKDGEALSASRLSDGERSLIVMAGNLARRVALSLPEGADVLGAEAIVLIDEVELHLHPSWQQRIIPAMRETFPNTQFILSTHSPQVLSQVPADSLRILENFQLYSPEHPVLGRDANAILREVMGTPDRPRFVQDKVHEIARLLDAEKLDEARAKLEALRELLGPTDSEVLRIETMLSFLEDASETSQESDAG